MLRIDKERKQWFNAPENQEHQKQYMAIGRGCIDYKFFITENIFRKLERSLECSYPNTVELRLKLRKKFEGFVGFTSFSGTDLGLPFKWRQLKYKLIVASMWDEF